MKSLIDNTAPISPTNKKMSTAPAKSTPPKESTSKPEILSSNLPLESTGNDIKSTTSPKRDPLQERLERLANILDEATEYTLKRAQGGFYDEEPQLNCPNCEARVIQTDKICPNCQKSLRICPNCKSPITMLAKICPSCGSLL
ncbi:MAG: zinc ribbon domain-containing protein [Promethearchaeota archaeon]